MFVSRYAAALRFLALIIAVILPSVANAGKDPIYTGLFNNLAVSGYDTVAYFTESKPVKGSEKFSTSWNGADWRFSSAENLALFNSDPQKYAPQYGGYCAYAASLNKAVSADPKQWDVHNGMLYLNYNKSVRQDWLKDKEGYIQSADKNWPALLK